MGVERTGNTPQLRIVDKLLLLCESQRGTPKKYTLGRDMTDLNWEFPPNQANEIEGPKDSGIANFMENRKNSVIRESIQNSLDVQVDKNRPVRVDFTIVQIRTTSFKADSLLLSLDSAIQSPDNEEEYAQQFRRGYRQIDRAGGGLLDCLRITDSNTTGADDIPRENEAPSKWKALTKGTGSNVKTERDAAGSFGLGKFAAFAATDIRMVLYSAAWAGESDLHHRFQGKIILVSHIDNKGNSLRSTGYLGGPGFNPLHDMDVPREFRLREPGTAIYIPGYQAESRWRDSSIKIIIQHFFHAVIHNKLTVTVEGTDVNAKTIDKFTGLLDGQTANFVTASKSDPIAHKNIPGIGDVNIRIMVHNDETPRREITLVRDAGMMITDDTRSMNLRGLGSFPGHWHSFTAIIECLSHGEKSLLRESESPEHNRVSTDYISDPDRRREADRRLAELGQWVRDQIKQYAEPPVSDENDNASEMAKYLPIPDEGGLNTGDTQHSGDQAEIVTTPVQSNTAPRRSPSRRGRTQTRQGHGTNRERLRRDGQSRGGRTSRSGQGTGPVQTRTSFSNSRFRPGSNKPTHSVVVMFDNPGEVLRDVRLFAAVEDGPDVAMGITGASIAGNRLTVENDAVQAITDEFPEDRWSIEFTTREPVTNKTFYIRGMTENNDEV